MTGAAELSEHRRRLFVKRLRLAALLSLLLLIAALWRASGIFPPPASRRF